ncbi:hypothetical protein IKQ19_13745 [Candidatus Saccharibacteria bacterium]|nr:hypothetical protein [Candidatus Saccharibacteria bacterium]
MFIVKEKISEELALGRFIDVKNVATLVAKIRDVPKRVSRWLVVRVLFAVDLGNRLDSNG